MADRLFFWKSIDEGQEDCFGIYQGESEDLIGLLSTSKIAPNISIIDVTDGVLSECGWKNGSMNDEPLTVHVEGCHLTAPRTKRKTADTEAPRKKQKVVYDADGNVVPKAPRKPSEYNMFIKNNRAMIKEEYPMLTHQEIFSKCAELWKLQKQSREDE
jgi:hypothetical protein